MKQVFECGIVGESSDGAGDCLLARLANIPMPDTANRKLPDDFTIEILECDLIRGSIADMDAMIAKYERLCEAMMNRGYEVLRWRDNDKWCDCIRFRRKP